MPEEKKKRPYKKREYYEDLADYRAWLEKAGVQKQVISKYLRGVADFKKTGYAFEEDWIQTWKQEKTEEGLGAGLIIEMARGVKQYKHFAAGEPYKWVTPGRHGTKRCNMDCFNCIYPDCIC